LGDEAIYLNLHVPIKPGFDMSQNYSPI
jgi:hypothetical protein